MWVAWAVAVGVWVARAVAVGVWVARAVAVGVWVAWAVAVGVWVAWAVAVGVWVAWAVAVGVWVAWAVAVATDNGSSTEEAIATNTNNARTKNPAKTFPTFPRRHSQIGIDKGHNKTPKHPLITPPPV